MTIPQNGQRLKQFVGKLLTICLIVFDHFVGLALKGLGYGPPAGMFYKKTYSLYIQETPRKTDVLSLIFLSAKQCELERLCDSNNRER